MLKLTKFICSLIILLLATSCLANKIDSLKTDEELFAFLRPLLPERQRGFNFEYKLNQTVRGDSLNAHNWFTTDIDGNGETDLLVFEIQHGPRIIAILSEQGKYKKITNYTYGADFIYPVLKRVDNKNVILMYNLNQISYDTVTFKDVTTPLKCDTLIVLRNCFVNYIKSPRMYRVEKIEINDDGACEGECPKIDVVLYPKAFKSQCKKTEWWNRGKKYFGRLFPSQIRDIVFLLNNSNFSYLKNRYKNNWSDQTTTTITITYDGGKKKTISDYGSSSGNFTLNSIYRLAFDIAWQ